MQSQSFPAAPSSTINYCSSTPTTFHTPPSVQISCLRLGRKKITASQTCCWGTIPSIFLEQPNLNFQLSYRCCCLSKNLPGCLDEQASGQSRVDRENTHLCSNWRETGCHCSVFPIWNYSYIHPSWSIQDCSSPPSVSSLSSLPSLPLLQGEITKISSPEHQSCFAGMASVMQIPELGAKELWKMGCR